MFKAGLGILSDDGFISSLHESVDKSLLSGLGIVEITKHDRGALDPKLAGLIISLNLSPFNRNKTCFMTWHQASG